MKTLFYAPKGGQGVTSLAVAVAVTASKTAGPVSVVAGAGGDLRAIVGLAKDPSATATMVTFQPDEPVAVSDHPSIEDAVVQSTGAVIIDGDESHAGLCDHKVLVVRNCYLALNRATCGSVGVVKTPPDLVVAVTEPERSLSAQDIAKVTGSEVVEVPTSAAFARALDSGLYQRLKLPPGASGLIALVAGR